MLVGGEEASLEFKSYNVVSSKYITTYVVKISNGTCVGSECRRHSSDSTFVYRLQSITVHANKALDNEEPGLRDPYGVWGWRGPPG